MSKFADDTMGSWKASHRFACLLLGVSLLMWLTLRGYPERPAWADFHGPVLSIQLAGSEDEFLRALGPGDPGCLHDCRTEVRRVVIRNTILDFIFVVCYSGFVGCFATLAASHQKAAWPVRSLPVYLITAAGLADTGENIGILYAILSDRPSLWLFIAFMSLIKWTAFYISTLGIGALLFLVVQQAQADRQRSGFLQDLTLTGLLALLLIASGIVGLCGWSTPSHFQHGLVLFAPLPLVTAFWPILRKFIAEYRIW